MTLVTDVLSSAAHFLTVLAINTSCARPRPRPTSNPNDISVSDVISKSHPISSTFTELQVATHNFRDKLVVSRGGYGKVYKGLLPDGSIVAIKRSKDSCGHTRELFQAEVEISSMVRHRNLVPAIGFCVSKKAKAYILVYPFKVNGDLRSRLNKLQPQPPLDWTTRKRILLGAAQGLSYLHDNGIIHREIKAANVLLDENLGASIGDWGLAKFLGERKLVLSPTSDVQVQNHKVLGFATERNTAISICDQTHITSLVKGTPGYIDPEYFSSCQYKPESDVHAFGVLIFEIVTAERAFDRTRMANGGYAL